MTQIYIWHGTLNQNTCDRQLYRPWFSNSNNTKMPTLSTWCMTGKLEWQIIWRPAASLFLSVHRCDTILKRSSFKRTMTKHFSVFFGHLRRFHSVKYKKFESFCRSNLKYTKESSCSCNQYLVYLMDFIDETGK